MLGNNAGALLLDHMDHRLGSSVDQGVQERSRYRDTKTQNRGHERFRNTAGHRLRITRTEERDCLERLDHTDYRTEQTGKRCNHRNHLDQSDIPG